MPSFPLPTKPGFYWGKWRIADDGTHEADLVNMMVHDWEVVHVFENCLDEGSDERFRVEVPGVRESQALENFFWGPGPIEPPASPTIDVAKPDFVIGLRGGDYWAFCNTRRAAEHYRKIKAVWSAPNAPELLRKIEANGFTWKSEVKIL